MKIKYKGRIVLAWLLLILGSVAIWVGVLYFFSHTTTLGRYLGTAAIILCIALVLKGVVWLRKLKAFIQQIDEHLHRGEGIL